MRILQALLVILVLPLADACRSARVESEPGPAYALEVTNPLPTPMIISYDDGTGVRLLGTVAPNGSASFVITRPASRRISISATDEARTRTITRSVTLQSGRAAEVDLGS